MKWTPEKIERVRRMVQEGYHNRAIAGEMGCGTNALGAAMSRAGITSADSRNRMRFRSGMAHDSGPVADFDDCEELPDA